MITRFHSALTGLTLAIALAMVTRDSDARALRLHTHLVKSAPAADDTLTVSPAALELWFSEKVELPVTKVVLKTASAALVKLGVANRDDRITDAPIVYTLPQHLPAGSYTVEWSTAARDGHPAKGTFGFVIKGGS